MLLPRDPRNAYMIEENNGEETFVLDPSYAVIGGGGVAAQEDAEAQGIEMAPAMMVAAPAPEAPTSVATAPEAPAPLDWFSMSQK